MVTLFWKNNLCIREFHISHRNYHIIFKFSQMAFRLRIFNINQIFNYVTQKGRPKYPLFLQPRWRSTLNAAVPPKTQSNRKLLIGTAIGAVGIGFGLYSYFSPSKSKQKYTTGVALSEKVDYTKNDNIVDIIPSREISGPATIGLDLTLYQYQTCPFCCKVRSFLEFYGIPYKIVEVNPVMRQQLKFSKYKKVPILIAEDKEASKKHQLNDSSVIVSILGTFLGDISFGLEPVLKYYVPVAYINEDGKEVEEVMNKYFLMFGDKYKENADTYLKKERQWRKWADNVFVHVLSPNIYRTFDEALQAFNYFSEVGEWEKNFSTIERLIVIYVGATAMYFVGKRLKKKHALKDDVRESLYDTCRQWMKEIGSKKKFMGGELPNLADLAVYGMLSSIEGCLAFQDLLKNTNIGPWYYNVKEAVVNHHGYQKLKL